MRYVSLVEEGRGGSEVEFIVNRKLPLIAPKGLTFGVGASATAIAGAKRQVCRISATGGGFKSKKAVLVRIIKG